MDTDIENTYFIPLRLDDVLKDPDETMIERIASNLTKENIVAVHVSELEEELTKDDAKNRRHR